MPTGSYNDVSESQLKQNSTLSHMTIPQLQRAQKILEGKLQDSNLDDFSKKKIERMLSRYVKAQYVINKYWKKTYNKQPGVTARNRNTLTLLEVYKNSKIKVGMKGLVKHEGANGYNALDMFNDVKGVALGVGVTAITIGAANQVANLFGTNAGTLLIEALKWLGPVNSSLILGGAALVVAAKVIPAIRRKADQMKKHRTYAQSLQNELTEEIHNNLDGFDPSLLDASNYEANKDEIVQKLFDNYKTLGSYYAKMLKDENSELNNSQRKNLRDALLKAQEKYNEFEAENGEFSHESLEMARVRKAKEDLEKEKEALNKEKEEFETTKNSADKAGEERANEIAQREKDLAERERKLAEAEKSLEQKQSQIDKKHSNQSSVKKANKRAETAETARDAATQRANDAEQKAAEEEAKRIAAEAEAEAARKQTEEAKAETERLKKELDEAKAKKDNENATGGANKTVEENQTTQPATSSPALNEFTKLFASKIDTIQTKKGSTSLNALFSDVVNGRDVLGMKIPEEAKQEILDFLKAVEGYQSGKGRTTKGQDAVSRYMAEQAQKALDEAAKGE